MALLSSELDPSSVLPSSALVPSSYAEKAMASLLQLHQEVMEEKERRVDLYRRLMEREQNLAELRMYVQVLEDRLARTESLPGMKPRAPIEGRASESRAVTEARAPNEPPRVPSLSHFARRPSESVIAEPAVTERPSTSKRETAPRVETAPRIETAPKDDTAPITETAPKAETAPRSEPARDSVPPPNSLRAAPSAPRVRPLADGWKSW